MEARRYARKHCQRIAAVRHLVIARAVLVPVAGKHFAEHHRLRKYGMQRFALDAKQIQGFERGAAACVAFRPGMEAA